ncbi:MAG: MltA domain-containing protein [Phycisphaerae bacterium]
MAHQNASRFASCALFFLALGLTGCPPRDELEAFRPRPSQKDYNRPLPPGALALRKIAPEDYPDFSRAFANLAGLEQSIQLSLSYLAKPSSQRYFPYGDIPHARAVASLKTFLDLIHTVRSGEQLDAEIRRRFDVYQSIGCDDAGTMLYTGYYTPIFDGRKRPDGVFRYPLYALPPDLVKDGEGRTQGRRTPQGQIVPYYSRREIEERGLLRGREIAWLKDPFEAYVVSVQGSAKLRLADGSLWELGYAGNNGHNYVPIAQSLIADGVLTAAELSLQHMIDFFRQNPDKITRYTWSNPRFIFFQEVGGGPFGSIGVPVTAYRSLATDKDVFPRACLAFIDTQLPVPRAGRIADVPYAGFACDQDTGGAIRAAGRCDVYLGVGDSAGALAGRTWAEGRLYYVFVR